MNYTINIRGQLFGLDEPKVMGIINVTPDSFYVDSRTQTAQAVEARVRQMVADGAQIIDIGACSTRPGSERAAAAEEASRLRVALAAARRSEPRVALSVDTFRPDVARMAVEEYGVDIINDVDEGQPDMLRMVARLGVPYILMSARPTLRSTLLLFAERVQQLRDLGQKDIILDPGFGFGKTLEQNYELLGALEKLQVMELPVLVGLSRKSMIHRLLGIDPTEALNGTTALHAIALLKGASILRVHDVKEAVECCRLVGQMVKPSMSENVK